MSIKNMDAPIVMCRDLRDKHLSLMTQWCFVFANMQLLIIDACNINDLSFKCIKPNFQNSFNRAHKINDL